MDFWCNLVYTDNFFLVCLCISSIPNEADLYFSSSSDFFKRGIKNGDHEITKDIFSLIIEIKTGLSE